MVYSDFVVLDDNDTSVTAGSIVTVLVNLKRYMMFDKEELSEKDEDPENETIYQVEGICLTVIRVLWHLQIR